VDKVLAFAASQISEGDLSELMKDESKFDALVGEIQALVYTTRDSMALDHFSSIVSAS
jgi:hypothetical protein